jgi:hypothetical protein
VYFIWSPTNTDPGKASSGARVRRSPPPHWTTTLMPIHRAEPQRERGLTKKNTSGSSPAPALVDDVDKIQMSQYPRHH